MKSSLIGLILAIIITASFVSQRALADVKLPNIVASHMVMQRETPLILWGSADAGERVTVTMKDRVASVVTNAKGKWRVKFPPQKADAKPRSIVIKGKNEITLTNILIGDVWIGSGQSNMEWHLRSTHGAQQAIAAANYPQIRLFHVPKVQKKTPASDVNAHWKVCTPQNIPTFSAVLYYFGRELHKNLNVPVGLINSSWGGSPIEPWISQGKNKSGGMYNGMIAPLTSFSVKGAIWYQGETNVLHKNGLKYYDKKKLLINGWRKAFSNENLPFFFVQIAPWSGRYEAGQLPALWEAQVKTLKIPHTGMAVTTDLVDNIRDIHPRNKLDVANRLARWALTKTYGKKGIVYSGPLYISMKKEGSKVRLFFAHTAKGLKSRDGKSLTEFKIAGADGKFVPGTAVIDGHTILVHADSVKSPRHVRFGWHKTANPNLVNSGGLPASPFQTNKWQGGTGEK